MKTSRLNEQMKKFIEDFSDAEIAQLNDIVSKDNGISDSIKNKLKEFGWEAVNFVTKDGISIQASKNGIHLHVKNNDVKLSLDKNNFSLEELKNLVNDIQDVLETIKA